MAVVTDTPDYLSPGKITLGSPIETCRNWIKGKFVKNFVQNGASLARAETGTTAARNSISASGELLLYGQIGDWWDGNDALSIVQQLEQLSGDELHVRIHSQGGNLVEGLAIYNRLKQSPKRVVVHVDGMALSMAGVVMCAGDEVIMPDNALFMMHKPWNEIKGNAEMLREAAESLDMLEESLVPIYIAKSGLGKAKISAMLQGETWFNGKEAQEMGFVDTVIESVQVAANFDVSNFDAPADKLAALITTTTEEIPMETAQGNGSAGTSTVDAAAEDKRVAGILKVFAQARSLNEIDQGLVHEWIEEGITASQARERMLDIVAESDARTLPGGGHLRVGDFGGGFGASGRDFHAAAVDALAMRNGIAVADPHPAAGDLQRMSVVDMAEASLRSIGVNTGGMSSSVILSKALHHSTSDFSFILADVGHKSLLEGYELEPNTAEGWTSDAPIVNFKPQHRVQLSEAPDFDLVLENGEYKEGTFGESDEVYRLYTYGKLFGISREAMINDDLSAFTRIPQAFGQSARRRELDIVFEILTGNPNMSDGNPLFDASHGNLAAAGAELSVNSLGEARAAMRKQKGLAGKAVLNIAPRYLIVPASLETAAEELINSLVNPARSNDTGMVQFIRSLSLVVDARLDESSETAWYLSSSPAQMETIERGYLDGMQGVYIETREGFEVDGVEFKARIDFGAKALNWRGLYMNPGA